MSVICQGWSFIFQVCYVSNRDKGLHKSLSIMFPRNHATNCVHHIKQNVKTWFGPNAAEMVFPIANDFLTIQEETLFKQLKTNSASAYPIWNNPNGAMVQYTMDTNMEVTTTTAITTLVWCGDI